MSEQVVSRQRYKTHIRVEQDQPNTFLFQFAPVRSSWGSGNGNLPQRMSLYTVLTQVKDNSFTFDWSKSEQTPGLLQPELEEEVRKRLTARREWIDKVSALIGQVEEWAKELDWSTRRIEKRLEDAFVGKHVVPALLLQQETCRALLEPIGRSSTDADGVVDLYLMPAYDDVAVLFHHENRWNLHYNTSRGTNAVVPTSKAEAVPLSKEILEKVLAEMKQNAV